MVHLTALFLSVTINLSVQGTPDADPCTVDVTPQFCFGFNCFHGNCATLSVKDGHLELGSCTCVPGWHGRQCQICDGVSTTRQGIATSGIDDDPDTAGDQSSPGYATGPDLVASTPVVKYCSGRPVLPVVPSSCHGLACLHGLCRKLSSDTIEAYVCECDEGWTGLQCDTCCDLTCNQGRCHVDYDTKQMYCVCDNSSFTSSSNCTEFVGEPTSSGGIERQYLWSTAGVTIFLVCGLILILTLLPYFMWKKRYLFVMKIIHYFQKYDETERPFHVFISYRSSADDENFVVEKLHPQLENMHLRVCVHYKDFVPGSTIAENIIRAVENSSRTILVLSPAYCSGGWPRFEVHAAQREMMSLRHRIVPILFKDVTEIRSTGNVDKLLEYILDTVTYIKWPGSDDPRAERRFWEQLRLAMPKVRENAGIPGV